MTKVIGKKWKKNLFYEEKSLVGLTQGVITSSESNKQQN
jgi:hypothetical protein